MVDFEHRPAHPGRNTATVSLPLTPMEEQILWLSCAGDLTGKEVARKIQRSEQSVKNHLATARAKIGVHTTHGACFRYFIEEAYRKAYEVTTA